MTRVLAGQCICLGLLAAAAVLADEPPALNPFSAAANRDDAIPGYCELSNGKRRFGQVYLTRDVRLKIYDQTLERQREVPLAAVRQIQCLVDKEWLEKEWRFKENANDQKVFTGRSYPTRECRHTITLKDGRTITGPLSAIVYVAPEEGGAPERFLLHKRQKGDVGMDLRSLVYVKTIALGEEALAEAKRRADPEEK